MSAEEEEFDLLEIVRGCNVEVFVDALVDLLYALGYSGLSSDGVIEFEWDENDVCEGVICRDPLGLDRTYVRAVRKTDGLPIGGDDLTSFLAGLRTSGAPAGVLVTTSEISATAEAMSAEVDRHFSIVNGEKLERLLFEHEIGCVAEEPSMVIDGEYWGEEE